MPRRPDNLETVRLTIELLRRIPRGRKVSAPELHEQLVEAGIERDLRTVQRQLEMLAENFDIERDDKSKPYGYRWKENARGLSMPMMTEQEALLLALAERQLRSLLPASLMRSMEGFFAQAARNLGPDRNAKQKNPACSSKQASDRRALAGNPRRARRRRRNARRSRATRMPRRDGVFVRQC